MVGCKPVDQIHTGQWSKPWPELTSVSFLLSSSQPIFTSACLACSCGHKNRYSQSSDTITTATTKSLHAFATLGSKVCFTVTETGFRCEVSINNVKKIKIKCWTQLRTAHSLNHSDLHTSPSSLVFCWICLLSEATTLWCCCSGP